MSPLDYMQIFSEALDYMQIFSEAQDKVVAPFSEQLASTDLKHLSSSQRGDLFKPGGDLYGPLSRLVEQVEDRNVHCIMSLLGMIHPYEPIMIPVLDRAREVADEETLRDACFASLSSIIDEWDVGISPAENDSIKIATQLHRLADRLPGSAALSMARQAGHVFRRGPDCPQQASLEWVVDRLCINPSLSDQGRNPWHEVMAFAVMTSKANTVHPDLAVFDRMPMSFIEKVSSRYLPDALPDRTSKSCVSSALEFFEKQFQRSFETMPDLLLAHAGSLEGMCKAMSLSQEKRMNEAMPIPARLHARGRL